MATNPASVSDQAFKAHIHRLLDEHVATHLTTSYVDCTQIHVYEVSIAVMTAVEVDRLLASRYSPLACCQSQRKIPVL